MMGKHQFSKILDTDIENDIPKIFPQCIAKLILGTAKDEVGASDVESVIQSLGPTGSAIYIQLAKWTLVLSVKYTYHHNRAEGTLVLSLLDTDKKYKTIITVIYKFKTREMEIHTVGISTDKHHPSTIVQSMELTPTT